MVELTMTAQEGLQMTGRWLMKAVGILDKYDSWRHNDHVSFKLNCVEWTAYTTAGRGKKSGITYLHIYRPVQVRVVDTDGRDTGMRVDDVKHLCGKASDPISSYVWIN